MSEFKLKTHYIMIILNLLQFAQNSKLIQEMSSCSYFVQKTLLGGRVEGWVEVKAGLRIAYSNQKYLIIFYMLLLFKNISLKAIISFIHIK